MRILIYIIALLCPWYMKAQNLPQMSSVHWDPYIYNPAFAGVTGTTQLTAHFRSQWQGIEGQPQTQLLSAYTPIDVIDSGMGLMFWGDQIGQVKSQNLVATFNHMVTLPFGVISVGVAAGMDRKSFFGMDWRAPDGEYGPGVVSHNDPLLSDHKVSGIAPRIDAAIYLVTPYAEVGFSSQNISPFTYHVPGVGEDGKTYQTRSYVVQAATFYDFSDDVLIIPSAVLKTNGHLTQFEIGAGVDLGGLLKGGLYFRGYNRSTFDALMFQAGYQFAENAYVYYTFDLGLSGLRKVHDNSHEVSLRYIIDEPLFKVRREKIIYNPRFTE